MVVVGFAGGGGSSQGIKRALGRDPDIGINHDRIAVAMHRANHPGTSHHCQNIWQAHPHDLVGHRRVGLAWFSPDCRHFSKAKGGRPVAKNIRDLAWVVVVWAKTVRPRIIMLENVEEFRTWGPLTVDNRPCPERAGQEFQRWCGELRRLGYRLEWRELRACDYGAPTIRRRLYLVARCDGAPIVWPGPTHGPDRPLPWRTAAEIIDWSLPCPSIFLTREEGRALGCKRPLVDATMRRIAKGVMRYVLQDPAPFILPITHTGGDRVHSGREPLRTVTTAHRGEFAAVVPHIHRMFGASVGHAADEPAGTVTAGGGGKSALVAAHLTKFRTGATGADLREPAPTVTANSYVQRPGGAPPLGVVAAFLAQHNTGVVGHGACEPVSTVTQTGSHQAVIASHLMNMHGGDRRMRDLREPSPTTTAGGWHAAEVRAFLLKYYGTADGQPATAALHSVTSRARFGLVTVELQGEPYILADIGMRMLSPRELFRAQGFPEDFVIDIEVDGRAITRTDQIRCAGNSVCPDVAAALVRANVTAARMARAVA